MPIPFDYTSHLYGYIHCDWSADTSILDADWSADASIVDGDADWVAYKCIKIMPTNVMCTQFLATDHMGFSVLSRITRFLAYFRRSALRRVGENNFGLFFCSICKKIILKIIVRSLPTLVLRSFMFSCSTNQQFLESNMLIRFTLITWSISS